jgi:7-carboxy-7-deazaguanine synthase
MPFLISEYFKSVQGEGQYTGIPSVFIRLWGCNFQCAGFTNPDFWTNGELDIGFNPADFTDIKAMPVIEHGCDSRYSHAREFLHLAEEYEAHELGHEIEDCWGHFQNKDTKQHTHLVFTGGEPLSTNRNQNAIHDILEWLLEQHNLPKYVTIETNGSCHIQERFVESFEWTYGQDGENEIMWSVSPKLRFSGEDRETTLRPDVLSQYAKFSNVGQLKYVVDGSDETWDEVELFTNHYRNAGVDWDVWVMPVGSTKEQQEEVQRDICEQSIDRGYNFCPRVHSWVFGNEVGT